MTAMTDAARQACRAWYTSQPMGKVMSDLADQLARIDKGQTHGAYSKARDRADVRQDRHGQGHGERIAATATGGDRSDRAAQARD